ncbi:MAG: hypothetical protein RI992_456 [Actinomycetota bacterium]|jgi:DNA-binding response OmpR family regulator
MDTTEAPNNILLLEDDSKDRLDLRLQLEVMGFTVYDTPNPDEAKELFVLRDYVCVLIHVSHLPLRGLEICRWVRSESTVPIIMFTCRDEVVNEQMCLNAGADDYVTKPIESRILTSRIGQQVKRGESQRAPRATLLSWGPLAMDLATHTFTIEGKEVGLTNTEYRFLQLLMENPHRVFSRDQILEAIGVMRGVGSNHLVDTHASRIRRKIVKAGGPNLISVIRSVGFRLASPTDKDEAAS